MHGYVYRLMPPRPTFAVDMTAAEAATMRAHVSYWSELAAQGKALAFGPVADPDGLYGVAVVLAEDRGAVEAIRANDPAIRSTHSFTATIATIQHLITPNGHYQAPDEIAG
jgi:uncharacterized protein YciI